MSSSPSSNLCDLLKVISEHPKYTGNIYFIPNNVEGRGELGSYLGNQKNNDVIVKVLEENKIEDGNINNSIYASVGSSSTQMFIPQLLDEKLCDDLTKDYGTKCDVVDKWTILLVPDNFFGGNFVPLLVLKSISEKNPELNILIGNSFSHLAYGYEKKYNFDKISDNLFNLQKNINSGGFYDPNKKEIVSKTLNTIINGGGEGFAKKVIVAPRIKNAERIENGWNLTLSLPNNTKFVDFGGGKTNKLYDDYITSKINANEAAYNFLKIIEDGLKKNQNDGAGCTGVIRAEIEKMVNSKECKYISVVPGLTVNSEYKNFFSGISPSALNVVKVSTEGKGGKRTRRNRRRRNRRGVKISRKRRVMRKGK